MGDMGLLVGSVAGGDLALRVLCLEPELPEPKRDDGGVEETGLKAVLRGTPTTCWYTAL